jgi:hypothetical protein
LAAPSAASAAEEPELQAIAARSLVQDLGLSKEEAMHRLEYQDAVAPTLRDLPEVLGKQYGGAWFDFADDGRLKIAVVDRDSATSREAIARVRQSLKSAGPLAAADFVEARWSYDELVAAKDAVSEVVFAEKSSPFPSVSVDVANNAVAVARGKALTEGSADLLRSARLETAVQVRDEVVPNLSPEKTACSLPYCDRPLRGGVWIGYTVQGVTPACTAGFNVTSRSDGKRYLLTAGHCVAGLPSGTEHWTRTAPGGSALPIGPTHNHNMSAHGDAGIIRDKVPSYWQQSPFPADTVVVDDIPGVHGYFEDYHVDYEANPAVGQIICTTGGGGVLMFWEGQPFQSWTWCAGVTVASVNIQYDDGTAVYGLFETSLCMWPGMSGGPVYKTGTAFGINSGTDCPDSQKGWHYPVIASENALNVDLVH